MDGLRFEWDPAKAAANLKKHGVSFEEAKTSFFDQYARIILDEDHSRGEHRLILLGLSMSLNVLVIPHVATDVEEVIEEPFEGRGKTRKKKRIDNYTLIRIISARKADPAERRKYAEFLP
jgi:uncharacterized DUF497 family protein